MSEKRTRIRTKIPLSLSLFPHNQLNLSFSHFPSIVSCTFSSHLCTQFQLKSCSFGFCRSVKTNNNNRFYNGHSDGSHLEPSLTFERRLLKAVFHALISIQMRPIGIARYIRYSSILRSNDRLFTTPRTSHETRPLRRSTTDLERQVIRRFHRCSIISLPLVNQWSYHGWLIIRQTNQIPRHVTQLFDRSETQSIKAATAGSHFSRD